MSHVTNSIDALVEMFHADFGNISIADKRGKVFTADQIFMMGVNFALPLGKYEEVEQLCEWLESGEVRTEIDSQTLHRIASLIRESFLGQTTKGIGNNEGSIRS